jgi:protein-L-isoaspartate(D-aspartate) O-methyltransferase
MKGGDMMDDNALTAFFDRLDRARFIEGGYKTYAGLDKPLPIGNEQTISQPTLVLEMTRLLSPESRSKVLEIGTGSGYQTAFLAEFSGQVYTVERFAEFTRQAGERLSALGYANISYRTGDGSEGWPEEAPFDRIIVTAAAGSMPEALVSQLAAGGRMLVPVGDAGMQVLKLVTKDQSGAADVQDVELVRFVELKGRYGW